MSATLIRFTDCEALALCFFIFVFPCLRKTFYANSIRHFVRAYRYALGDCANTNKINRRKCEAKNPSFGRTSTAKRSVTIRNLSVFLLLLFFAIVRATNNNNRTVPIFGLKNFCVGQVSSSIWLALLCFVCSNTFVYQQQGLIHRLAHTSHDILLPHSQHNLRVPRKLNDRVYARHLNVSIISRIDNRNSITCKFNIKQSTVAPIKWKPKNK